ncbi:MAG: DUF1844 domain-containing protein [Deltaproteobacteria bacterium]|jgi:hypothetical protein|nr:DUF1844 domain-containing protein [Deltaproteobacteria bacterium]MCL6120507.1 DUF1844 domain-containing protein [Deltaproteobacteria bacterium]
MSDKEGEKSFKVIDKRKTSEAEEIEEAKNAEEAKPAEKVNENTARTADSEKKAADETAADMPDFEADFAAFVYSLNTQALLFMGKIPNPISKKYEKDLGTAKYLIDTIDMLSKKTKGNLDENEAKLIENILYDLRMAYISEKK